MDALSTLKTQPSESWNKFDMGLQNENIINSKYLFYNDEIEETKDDTEFKRKDAYFQTEILNNKIRQRTKRKKVRRKKYGKKNVWNSSKSEKDYIGQPEKKKRTKIKKNNSDRRESYNDWPMTSVMHSMLDFLTNPGDFFENMQSSYAGGQPDHSFGGGGGYKGVGGTSVSGGYSGGGEGTPSNGAGGIFDGLGGILGDTSLSRKDFVIELTTWFRRAVWFLAFTSATTVNPGLFAVAAVLALVFELVYNVTNARMYWDNAIGYDNVDHVDKGNIDYVDSYNKADYDYEQVEYAYQDFPTKIYPMSRNIQISSNKRNFYRPWALMPLARNLKLHPSRRFIGSSTLMNISPNKYRHNLRSEIPFNLRRSGVEFEEQKPIENQNNRPNPLNWRYVLGLPPWFLKE